MKFNSPLRGFFFFQQSVHDHKAQDVWAGVVDAPMDLAAIPDLSVQRITADWTNLGQSEGSIQKCPSNDNRLKYPGGQWGPGQKFLVAYNS